MKDAVQAGTVTITTRSGTEIEAYLAGLTTETVDELRRRQVSA